MEMMIRWVVVAMLVEVVVPSHQEASFSSIACASSGRWCVVADEARAEVLSVDLVRGSTSFVWGGERGGGAVDGSVWSARFDGPRSVALYRNDTAILVGDASGVRSVDLATLAVSTLEASWVPRPREAPVALAVDERGAGVRTRPAGLAVVHALFGDGRVFTADVDATGFVTDARLAVESGAVGASGLAFDASRGELLIAARSALYASAAGAARVGTRLRRLPRHGASV